MYVLSTKNLNGLLLSLNSTNNFHIFEPIVDPELEVLFFEF